jgi:hypothetical protein
MDSDTHPSHGSHQADLGLLLVGGTSGHRDLFIAPHAHGARGLGRRAVAVETSAAFTVTGTGSLRSRELAGRRYAAEWARPRSPSPGRAAIFPAGTRRVGPGAATKGPRAGPCAT